jgi:hypothetical protein
MDSSASVLSTCKTIEVKDVSVNRVEYDWCSFTAWLQLHSLSYELYKKRKL